VAEKGARALLPTRFTVATEDNALSRRLYLYTPAIPSNPFTRKFVLFALSTAGQDVVSNTWVVAQNVLPEPKPREETAGIPVEYTRLTQDVARLLLNFRFRTGKADLDNKAVLDVDPVVNFIESLKYKGNNIVLLGFADNIGSELANQKLSLDRAKAVEEEFMRRGKTPAIVRGFGSRLPVASNASDEGREKNRRVEIWVKE
jgi:phosphate transport system substrate-binding protein